MTNETLGMLCLVSAMTALYFTPTLLAIYRRHPSGGGIAVVNLFLGWTLVGWVAALAWSLSAVRRES